MVSLTGISSGRVTSSTRQRVGSFSISRTSAAWVRIGPPRAASSRPLAEVRKVTAWPVAGASRTIRSAAAEPLELLDLAQHQDVADPGDGGGDDVDDPGRDEPARDPMEPVVAQVLEQRVVGGDPASARPSPARRRRVSRPRSRAGPRWPNAAVSRGLSLQLDRAGPTARGGPPRRPAPPRSVVLPTPPLPATTSTLLSVQNAAMSICRRA